MKKNKIKEEIKYSIINNIIKETDITLKFNDKKDKNVQSTRITKKVTNKLNQVLKIAKFPLLLNLLESKSIIKQVYKRKKPNIVKINEILVKKSNNYLNFEYLNLKITNKLLILTNKYKLIN